MDPAIPLSSALVGSVVAIMGNLQKFLIAVVIVTQGAYAADFGVRSVTVDAHGNTDIFSDSGKESDISAGTLKETSMRSSSSALVRGLTVDAHASIHKFADRGNIRQSGNLSRALQHRQHANAEYEEPSEWKRARSFMPIFYLHFPKCGSSWASLLGNFAMQAGISKGKPMWAPDRGGVVHMPQTVMERSEYCSDRVPSIAGETITFNHACRNRFNPDAPCFLRYESDHKPLTCPNLAPHVSVMFRHPLSRVQSGWNHIDGNGFHHDCITGTHAKKISQQQYAHCVGNCMTNMLNGEACGQWKASSIDTDLEEVIGAVEDKETKARKKERQAVALVEKLGFLGLTEEWPLSVCLFHVMFGGECSPESFANSRPGQKKDINSANWTGFGSAFDSDLKIYEKARRIFDHRLKQYGVTHDRCQREICERAANHFWTNLSVASLVVYDED